MLHEASKDTYQQSIDNFKSAFKNLYAASVELETDQLLQAARILGAIAVNIDDLSQFKPSPQPSTEVPVPIEPSDQPVPIEIPTVFLLADTTEPVDIPELMSVKEPSAQAEPTPVQAAVLAVFKNNPDTPFSSRQIMDEIGLSQDDPRARERVVYAIKMLRDEPEHTDIAITGNTRGRLYTWRTIEKSIEKENDPPVPLSSTVEPATREQPLSIRDKQVLEIIQVASGQPVTSKDVLNALDLPNSALRVINKSLTKLQGRKEARGLFVDRTRHITHYSWIGNSVSKDLPVVAELPEPEAALPLPEPLGTDLDTKILTDWGLSISANGLRQVLFNDRPVKLRDVTAQTLTLLAERPSGITFDSLLEKLSSQGQDIEITYLRGVIDELDFFFESYGLQQYWSNTIVSAEDGEPTRELKLLNIKEEETDFLAQR